ncbi:pilin [Psychrobacter sp. T6-5]|uniref:pilin n=1 Tax=Psychrobacter sp. T6-5 TaxID=3457451 RepID=UPI003FCF4C74
MNTQKGFTLIELMIVVAIIGILAAIAIPQYQNYIAKSQVSRVMSEVGSMRTAAETCLNEGKAAGDCQFGWTGSNLLGAEGDGTSLQTGLTATFGGQGEDSTLSATFGDSAATAITGKNLTWKRTGNGAWTCSTTVDAKYAPSGCPVAGSDKDKQNEEKSDDAPV